MACSSVVSLGNGPGLTVTMLASRSRKIVDGNTRSARRAPEICSEGSMTCGYSVGLLRRNARAGLFESPALMPINAMRSPYFADMRRSIGNSWRQGLHHEAHLLMTTG
jgi:hypothetical protein